MDSNRPECGDDSNGFGRCGFERDLPSEPHIVAFDLGGDADGTISLHYDDRVLEVPLRVGISHLRAVRLTPAGQPILPTVGLGGSQSASDRGVVNVTLTNLGTIAATYVLEASSISVSNASWVGGWTVLIDPPTLRLDPRRLRPCSGASRLGPLGPG